MGGIVGESVGACRGGLPPERVGLGLAAAGVAVGAAVVLAAGLSGRGWIAAAATVPMAAVAAQAYAVASGGRLQRGVAPLVMLLVSGSLACVILLVFIDAWHAYDLFGPDLLRVSRPDFLRWALTSPAVLADYRGSAALAAAGTVLGALTALPRIRATLAAPNDVPREATHLGPSREPVAP